MRLDREIQDQLYDPASKAKSLRMRIARSPRSHQKRPPRKWFYAMLEGIRKHSDVRNPASIVGSIWQRLSPRKRAEIKLREEKGEHFRYDLPLPEDHATKGTGTVRVVKPFDLAEVQVNVSSKTFERLKKSGLFRSMRRQDGSIALVKRCKSPRNNCNIFVDRM